MKGVRFYVQNPCRPAILKAAGVLGLSVRPIGEKEFEVLVRDAQEAYDLGLQVMVFVREMGIVA